MECYLEIQLFVVLWGTEITNYAWCWEKATDQGRALKISWIKE